MEKIKSHAKVAIIGGGILGVSLLYHSNQRRLERLGIN